MVEILRDHKISGLIDRNTIRRVDSRTGRNAAAAKRIAVLAVAVAEVRLAIDVVGVRIAAGDGRDISRDGIHFAHDVIARVGDVYIARWIARYAERRIQLSGGREAAIAFVASGAIAGRGADVAGCVHHPHAVIARIGDVQIPCGIERYAVRRIEPGVDRQRAVARVARYARSVACDGGDFSGGCDHFPDRIIIGIGDEEIARRIDRDALGRVQRRCGCRAAIARVSRRAGAGRSADRAGGQVHFADHVVVRIRDVDVARTIDGYATRLIQRRRGRHRGGAVITCCAIAGHGGNRARICTGREDFAHSVVVRVRDEEIARAIHEDAGGEVQIRLRCRTAVIHHGPLADLSGHGADRARNHDCQRTLPNASHESGAQCVVGCVQQHDSALAQPRAFGRKGHGHLAAAGTDPAAVVRSGFSEVQIRRSQGQHFDFGNGAGRLQADRDGLGCRRCRPHRCRREYRLGTHGRHAGQRQRRSGHQSGK